MFLELKIRKKNSFPFKFWSYQIHIEKFSKVSKTLIIIANVHNICILIGRKKLNVG